MVQLDPVEEERRKRNFRLRLMPTVFLLVLMAAGWLLALSAPLVVTGYQLLESAGVPSYLGVAWVPTLLAGLIMVTGGLMARKRLTSTWYWSNPELIT